MQWFCPESASSPERTQTEQAVHKKSGSVCCIIKVQGQQESYLDEFTKFSHYQFYLLQSQPVARYRKRFLEEHSLLSVSITQRCLRHSEQEKGRCRFQPWRFPALKFTSDLFYWSHQGAKPFQRNGLAPLLFVIKGWHTDPFCFIRYSIKLS